MSGKKKNTGDAVDQNGQELAAADMVAQAALRAKPVKPARHRLIKEDPPFKLDFTVYNFTERARKDLKTQRRQFKQVHGAFLSYVAERFPARLKAIGLDQAEIDAMHDGVTPVGYTVRHIKPLNTRESNNSFENLILIPQQPYGAKISQYIGKQVGGLKTGKTRQVKLPVMRSPVFPVPRNSVDAVNETRFRLDAERKAEAERRRQEKAEKQRVQEERAAQRREEKRLAEEAEFQSEQEELRAWPPRGYTLQELRDAAEKMGMDPDVVEQDIEPGDMPGDHSIEQDTDYNRDLIRLVLEQQQRYDVFERKRRGKNKGKNQGGEKGPKANGRIIFPSGPSANVHGMPVVEVEYVRRTKQFIEVDGERVDKLRYEGLVAKQKFLKMLADEHGPKLKELYDLTDCEIEDMRQGYSPEGLSVHHKHPLGGVGDPLVAARANDFDNLILIPNEPYHNDIHRHLDPQISDMRKGERRKVQIAMPDGHFFVPPEPYKRSGPPKYETYGDPNAPPRECPPVGQAANDPNAPKQAGPKKGLG